MRRTQRLHCRRGGGVAGHHQQAAAVAGQLFADGQHAALNLFLALVAVGHMSGVGEVAEVGVGSASTSAASTERPPRPESKTPIMLQEFPKGRTALALMKPLRYKAVEQETPSWPQRMAIRRRGVARRQSSAGSTEAKALPQFTA